MGLDGIAVERTLKEAGQEANLDVAAAEFTSLVRSAQRAGKDTGLWGVARVGDFFGRRDSSGSAIRSGVFCGSRDETGRQFGPGSFRGKESRTSDCRRVCSVITSR